MSVVATNISGKRIGNPKTANKVKLFPAFDAIVDNSSQIFIKRGFCRSLYVAKDKAKLNEKKRKFLYLMNKTEIQSMNISSPLKVLNASAGSGKTHHIKNVVKYLKKKNKKRNNTKKYKL